MKLLQFFLRQFRLFQMLPKRALRLQTLSFFLLILLCPFSFSADETHQKADDETHESDADWYEELTGTKPQCDFVGPSDSKIIRNKIEHRTMNRAHVFTVNDIPINPVLEEQFRTLTSEFYACPAITAYTLPETDSDKTCVQVMHIAWDSETAKRAKENNENVEPKPLTVRKARGGVAYIFELISCYSVDEQGLPVYN